MCYQMRVTSYLNSKINFTCRVSVAAILIISLPSESEGYNAYYSCDMIYQKSVCVVLNISDISYWSYQIGDEISELKFMSCNFPELSTTISIYSGYYKPVRTIDLSRNHIRSLEKFHFELNYLLEANLSLNYIENLETPSIFAAHPHLRKIDLSYNLIAFIHADAFDGLTELEELFLNNNVINGINGLMWAPLVQLRCLDLSANFIETLENNSFGDLVHLQKLYLQRNVFVQFNFDDLDSNVDLRELSLGNDDPLSLTGNINLPTSVKLSKIVLSNFITHTKSVSITNSTLSNFTIGKEVENIVASNSSLTTLIFDFDDESPIRVADFSHNLLTGDLSFDNWRNLEILDLSFNRIENVSVTNCSLLTKLNLSNNNVTILANMTTLTNIKILDLSFNCIENFQLNTFGSMISLEVLNLRETCFQSIDYGTFSSQTNLRVLDISFNNLNSMDLNLLSIQLNLEDLFIDGNNLTEVQSLDSIGIYFPKLRSMGLTHNRWSCTTLNQMINKLYLLSVKVFVENSIKHTTNVKGIGCTTASFNSSKETLMVPESPMSLNHTAYIAYMSKIEKVNEIVKNVNELKDTIVDRAMIEQDLVDLQHDKSAMKSHFDDQIDQFKVFGQGIVHKFRSLNEINYRKLMEMKAKIAELNETNNEKYDVMSESVESLKEKLEWIQLNGKKEPEKGNKIATTDEMRASSEYYDGISTLKSLEILLITLLFVLFMVALYYVLVYC